MAEGGVNSIESSSSALPNPDNSSATTSGSRQFLETREGRRLAYQKLEGTSPGVVYIHGLKSTMEGEKAMALERFCRHRGISYLRFELSGHGCSSVEFKDCTVTMWLEDLVSMLKELTEGPQILVGASIGGWLIFLYTMRNPDNIYGLVGIGASPDFTESLWKGLSKEDKQEAKRKGFYDLKTPYSDEPYQIPMGLIQDGSKYSIMNMPGIEYIKSPVLLFHGEQDTIVPPSTALKLVQKLQCPVSLKTVQDGNHRLSRPQDIELVANAVAELLSPAGAQGDATDSTDQDD